MSTTFSQAIYSFLKKFYQAGSFWVDIMDRYSNDSYLCCCYDRIFNKGNVKKGKFILAHCLRLQTILWGLCCDSSCSCGGKNTMAHPQSGSSQKWMLVSLGFLVPISSFIQSGKRSHISGCSSLLY